MSLPDWIRPFNKAVTNRVFGALAGRSNTFFVIIRHVGRRSGRAYETPIIAFRRSDGFVVALTYGAQVDWYRNVVAAGCCTVVWHNHDYPIGRIDPLSAEQALPALPPPIRAILRALNVRDFAKLTDAAFVE